MATVSVCCKLPNGLDLQLCDLVENSVATVGANVKTIKEPRRYGEIVHINGNATKFGEPRPFEVSRGYAVTHGVDESFWNLWEKQNEGSPLLKNHIVFALVKPQEIHGKTKEYEAVRTGLEPLDKDDHRNRISKM